MLKHQETVLPIFVYGTLMVGERNYIDVLHDNLTHYENAKVKGTLYYYQKEDYPALTEGNHWIEGQIFYVNCLEEVLKPLDEIEGYLGENHPDNMYNRKIMTAVTGDGKQLQAYAYQINPRLFQKEHQEFTLMKENSWKKFNQLKG